jgi:SAM-dependent methyltransferase
MHNNYDTLARFYNKYWTLYAPELFGRVLDEFFLPKLPRRAKILDLCCGTGQVCTYLSDNGYAVTGLDLSEGMLAIARHNAPKAEFLHADARSFTITKPYDAVVSFFDSINHLMSYADLLACFKAVKAALKPDGYFLFDVNDIAVFTDIWGNGFSMVEDDSICILQPSFSATSGVAYYKITMLDKVADTGSWQREDITVQEQYYSPQEIMQALTEAGFGNIQMLDGEENLGITQFGGRLFFIAS